MSEPKGIREEFEEALNRVWFEHETCQEEMDEKTSIALWAARWMAERIADDGSITKQQREWILKSAKELGDSQ